MINYISSSKLSLETVCGQSQSIPLAISAQPLMLAVLDVNKNIQDTWTEVYKNLEATAAKTKRRADKHQCPGPKLALGDRIWFSIKKNIHLKVLPYKFAPHFIGLFKVLMHINLVTFHLKLPPFFWIPSLFHISLVCILII